MGVTDFSCRVQISGFSISNHADVPKTRTTAKYEQDIALFSTRQRNIKIFLVKVHYQKQVKSLPQNVKPYLKPWLFSSLLLSYCRYYCVHLHLLIFCQASYKRALLFFNHHPHHSRQDSIGWPSQKPPTRQVCVIKSGLLAKYYFTCGVQAQNKFPDADIVTQCFDWQVKQKDTKQNDIHVQDLSWGQYEYHFSFL